MTRFEGYAIAVHVIRGISDLQRMGVTFVDEAEVLHDCVNRN